MSTIMQQGPTSDDAKLQNHYHWPDLCISLSIAILRHQLQTDIAVE
jgi:hypothetical protein